MVRLTAGDLDGARAAIDAALAQAGFPEDDREYVHCTEIRARVAIACGGAALAGTLLQEALGRCERAGEHWYRQRVLEGLGACARLESRLDDAAEMFERCLASAHVIGDWRGLATAAESLASVALERGDAATAARLLGAAGELWQLPGRLPASWASRHDRTAARARAELGAARFEALRAAGAELSVDEAWRSDPHALLRGAARRLELRPAGPRQELTPRELQVLHLLDAPVSLREIAAELYVSQNTLKSHCRSLYRKLLAADRAEAVVRARELRLIE
jgi:LuxR family maltose regulon positive regulatory protein